MVEKISLKSDLLGNSFFILTNNSFTSAVISASVKFYSENKVEDTPL